MTRASRIALLAAVLAAALAGSLAPAARGASCAQQVIDDWIDNAKVDGVYEIHCYREAIAALPEDAAAYSSAAEDIRRALQKRLRDAQSAGGATTGGAETGSGGSAGSGGSGGTGGGTGGSKPPEGGSAGGGAPSTDGSGQPAGGEGSATVAAPANDLFTRGLDNGSGGVPTPLLVVLAAAGLLAAAAAVRLALRQRGRPPKGPAESSGRGAGD